MFDPMRLVKLDLEEEECSKFHSKVTRKDFERRDFEKWKDSYTHPLISNSVGSSASVFSTEIRKIIEDENMIHQFETQSEDQQQSNRPNMYRHFEEVSEKEETKGLPRDASLISF